MKKSILKFSVIFLSLIFYVGCSKNLPSVKTRLLKTQIFIKNHDLKEKIIQGNLFNIFSVQNKNLNCKNKVLKIFIEGDGLSWITKNKISSDPTPINAIGLKLMQKDKTDCKIYLARPCQYIENKSCEEKYWTSERFNEKIIKIYLKILTDLKKNLKNNYFELIGFSGGGAIATIIAAKRKDISKLITVAGNLNTKKWTKIHKISPLNGSMNPSNFTRNLENLNQIHYVGKYDKIMPIDIFESFKSKFKNTKHIKLILINAKHSNIYKLL